MADPERRVAEGLASMGPVVVTGISRPHLRLQPTRSSSLQWGPVVVTGISDRFKAYEKNKK